MSYNKTKFLQYWFVAEKENEFGDVVHFDMHFSLVIELSLLSTWVFPTQSIVAFRHEKQPIYKFESFYLDT